MAPINQDTIHVETWTNKDGTVKTQVIAEGDHESQGTWVHEYGIPLRNVSVLKGRMNKETTLLDVNVDDKGNVGLGQYKPTSHGVWRRLGKVER